MPGEHQPPFDDLPRSPTGRIPQWVIDEARGLPPATESWRTAPPLLAPVPPRTQVRRRRRLVPIALLGIAVVGVVHFWDDLSGPLTQLKSTIVASPDGPPGWLTGAAAGTAAGTTTRPHLDGVPTAGHEEAADPLGTPAPLAGTSDAYRFIATQDDGTTPVAWDPCRPIHYVIRPAGQPARGDELVASAISEVSRVTGLQFVDDGSTDEAFSVERREYQPDRYGDRWAPVLIVWETAAEQPAFADGTVGRAGPAASYRWNKGPQVTVTGTVELDADQFPEILDEPDGWNGARGVVMHELGHLVGLDHVEDPAELMNPVAVRGVSEFQPGDLTGLAALGSGACEPAL